jgi:hypothetical protein
VYASRRGIGRQRSDAVKRQRLAALICVTGCLLASAARADTIDFQGFGGSEGDSVVGSFTIFGGTNTVTFSNAVYAKAGDPRFAFQTGNGIGVRRPDELTRRQTSLAKFLTIMPIIGSLRTNRIRAAMTRTCKTQASPSRSHSVQKVSFLLPLTSRTLTWNNFTYEKLTATAIRETGPDVTVILDDNDSNGLVHNTVNRVVTLLIRRITRNH